MLRLGLQSGPGHPPPYHSTAQACSWSETLCTDLSRWYRPQNFNVVLDTGSSDLWVADSSCSGCDPATRTYDAAQSSTNQPSTGVDSRTTIRYGSGQVSGTIARETVAMGGFTIQNQVFRECLFWVPYLPHFSCNNLIVQVDRVSSSLVDDTLSGIMGLAFDTIASTQSTPFWQALSDGGQLTNKEMGFWLNRQRNNPSASDVEFGGIFTLGGTNSSLYSGDIDFVNMPGTQRTFWLLSMTGESYELAHLLTRVSKRTL